jgi:Fur family transcriptional regulator, ferric uptake regulator
MNGDADRILKRFQLRSTPIRQEILSLFLDTEYARSQSDFEASIRDRSDRVTVYRTLKTFLDKGLIHKVLDDRGGLKYALCREACTLSNHHHEHVHFKCTICGQTSCLSVDIPAMRLPKGFKAKEFNLLIQGICQLCNDNSKPPNILPK